LLGNNFVSIIDLLLLTDMKAKPTFDAESQNKNTHKRAAAVEI
jgi:hypothetical protein